MFEDKFNESVCDLDSGIKRLPLTFNAIFTFTTSFKCSLNILKSPVEVYVSFDYRFIISSIYLGGTIRCNFLASWVLGIYLNVTFLNNFFSFSGVLKKKTKILFKIETNFRNNAQTLKFQVYKRNFREG